MTTTNTLWLTARDVAERLNVTEDTVRDWVTGRGLPCATLGRVLRIPETQLDDWLAKAGRPVYAVKGHRTQYRLPHFGQPGDSQSPEQLVAPLSPKDQNNCSGLSAVKDQTSSSGLSSQRPEIRAPKARTACLALP